MNADGGRLRSAQSTAFHQSTMSTDISSSWSSASTAIAYLAISTILVYQLLQYFGYEPAAVAAAVRKHVFKMTPLSVTSFLEHSYSALNRALGRDPERDVSKTTIPRVAATKSVFGRSSHDSTSRRSSTGSRTSSAGSPLDSVIGITHVTRIASYR